jgi:hypothetical protein
MKYDRSSTKHFLEDFPYLKQSFDGVHPEYFVFKENPKMEDDGKYTVGRRRAGS